jgi:hypothetical protein
VVCAARGDLLIFNIIIMHKPQQKGKLYVIVYADHRERLRCSNFNDFISEVFERIAETDEMPDSIACSEHGKLSYLHTMFHYCFAKGRMTEQDLVETIREHDYEEKEVSHG